MINVFSDEFGYDTATLGFPSVLGCHAVVLVTAEGLYGFHNYGGSSKTSMSPAKNGVDIFAERAAAFASFCATAFTKAGKGTHLYGVCSRSRPNNRGYAGTPLKTWQEEMKAFAEALNYKGTITGFDLDKLNPWPNASGKTSRDSAYILFTKNGTAGCTIQIAPNDAMTYTKGPQPKKAYHKALNSTKNAVGPLGVDAFLTATITPPETYRTPTTSQLDTFKV